MWGLFFEIVFCLALIYATGWVMVKNRFPWQKETIQGNEDDEEE